MNATPCTHPAHRESQLAIERQQGIAAGGEPEGIARTERVLRVPAHGRRAAEQETLGEDQRLSAEAATELRAAGEDCRRPARDSSDC